MRSVENSKTRFSSPPGREAFRPREWAVVQRYRTPRAVQQFLRKLKYNGEEKGETLRTFRGALRHGEVHCLEAALVAAAILEQHGYPPLLVDLESQDNLDHVLFLFRHRRRWGAVARSRDAGLQGRKPVFRSVLQLVLSYVDPYVDGSGRITSYAVFDLRTLKRCEWRFSERNVWVVERALIRLPHRKLKISSWRYRKMLARYRAFRKKYPDRPALFYPNRHRWM